MKIAIALVALMAGTYQAKADIASLADWCVNLNGDIKTACNGGGAGGTSPLGGSINLAGFDKTLESSSSSNSNALGTVSVTLAPGKNQFVAFYADYDVAYGSYGSFADSGKVSGAPPAGVSYELADPNTSNIFNDFTGHALTNTNTVGTASGPPNECCDVSFALAASGINVSPGQSGTVTFKVTTSAPVGGFYIQQTNQYTGDSIYLQGTVQTGSMTATPEPTMFIPSLGLIGFLAWKRLRSA